MCVKAIVFCRRNKVKGKGSSALWSAGVFFVSQCFNRKMCLWRTVTSADGHWQAISFLLAFVSVLGLLWIDPRIRIGRAAERKKLLRPWN